MDSLFINLMIITGLLIAAAYFAMSEIALAGSRKLRLTRLAEKGDKRAKMVLSLKENPGSFFSVVQIGINAVAILGGIVGEAAFTRLFSDWFQGFVPPDALESVAFSAAFVTVTLLFIIFADLIPKRVAMTRPESTALGMVRLMQCFIIIFKPLVWLLTVTSGCIMKLLGIPTTTKEKITNEDIEATVEAGVAAGIIAPQEQTAITNVMDLESRLIPSAMTARDNIVYFDLCEDYESITAKVRAYPHSKFLVCDKTIDQIVGCVDSKELLKRYVNGQPFTLKESGLITQVLTVPDTLTLSETLDIFKTQKRDFAAVVNEYALTVGVITLKDILWVIMGDFVPTDDTQQIVKHKDGSWRIEGATPVEDIERLLSTGKMPDDESYETMAGFLMYMLRRVPKLSDRVTFAGYRFEVVDMEGARVNQIIATKIKAPEPPEQFLEHKNQPAVNLPAEKLVANQ